jgi:sugar lactone lactonase YvrE
MVGGIIIDIVKISPEKWWLNCVETGLGSGAGRQTCAIYVNPIGEPVEVGDNLWWQGGHAYWTPDGRSRTDVKLPRIGFSGVPHPHRDSVAR